MRDYAARVFARVFAQRLRRWHDSLSESGQLFGSPVTDDVKLWRSVKDEVKSQLAEVVGDGFEKAVTVKLQFSIRKIEPVRIAKKILIIDRDSSLSRKAKEACLASGKQHGEHRSMEVLTTENDLNIRDFFKRHNLTWNERDSETPVLFEGTKDFCLHFKSWLDCVRLKEPMMIMRQGTVFRSPVPVVRFKDVIVFGETHPLSRISSSKAEIFYPKYSLEDAYCYAVTPRGARKLIEAAQREITQAVNKFICKRYVDIIYHTEQSRPVEFMDALAHLPETVESQETVWKSYKAGD